MVLRLLGCFQKFDMGWFSEISLIFFVLPFILFFVVVMTTVCGEFRMISKKEISAFSATRGLERWIALYV